MTTTAVTTNTRNQRVDCPSGCAPSGCFSSIVETFPLLGAQFGEMGAYNKGFHLSNVIQKKSSGGQEARSLIDGYATSNFAISVSFGMRPADTSLPLTTSPGV
jgi:hypothetical protein